MTEKLILQELCRYNIGTYADIIYRNALLYPDYVAFSYQEETVTFKYKPVDAKNWKYITLNALEFMRRFLQHVLPKGFHKARYYGFLCPTNRQWLKRIRTLLLLVKKNIPVQEQKQEKGRNRPESSENSGDSTSKDKHQICPICMKGCMVEVMRLDAQSIPYKQRPPPWLTHHAKAIY